MNANSTTKQANPKGSKTYRYISSSLSRHMIRSLDRHLAKIGTPLTVRAISHGAHGGWYRLIVKGKLGKLVLRGCSWGYSGKGCRATEAVLMRLGLNPFEIGRAAFQTTNKEVGTVDGFGKEFFKFHLLPQNGEVTL